MRVSDFDYELPEGLIARYPAAQRTASRLLCLDGVSGDTQHRQFKDLLTLLKPGDLLVLNDTRVIPARLRGVKASGGRFELLVERILDDRTALVHLKSSRAPKPGTQLVLSDGTPLQVLARHDDLFELALLAQGEWLDVLEKLGEVPLPPYLERAEEGLDQARYQTVYARDPGAVAAPTAGLHFDEAMLAELSAFGIAHVFVTLHVGAGTFQNVRVTEVEAHVMHSERYVVGASTVSAIAQCKAAGGRVVAVGTTSVRSLESAAAQGTLAPTQGESELFIYPGFEFKVVDLMITNFHLPQSTLMMLVSAFSGRDAIMAAYAEAVASQYRFFSYGDAMLLSRQNTAQQPGVRLW